MKYKTPLLLVFLLCFSIGTLNAQTVKQFAGIENSNDPESQVNKSTVDQADVRFYYPTGITWDNDGDMWVTERNKIRLFYNGKVYNRAGNVDEASTSLGYANGTGIQTKFYSPYAIVSDASGKLFVTDDENHAIRQIAAFVNTSNAQTVTTFAGKNPSSGWGTSGSSNGNGTNASFYNPRGMAIDASGNLYVAEFNNFCIRKITPSGQVTTLAGNITVQGTKDGTGTGAEFGGPTGIAVLDANYLVVTDFDNGTIRKVHMTSGVVTTLCGVAGDNVIVDGNFSTARFRAPRGITVADGKIYVCDESTVRVIDVNAGTVATFAGDKNSSGNVDGEGTNAKFGITGGIAYDGKISLYVTDWVYNVIKTITINDLAPAADFAASKTNALVDEAITFNNTSAGKPATAVKWTITPASHTIVSGTTTSTPIDVKFQVAGFYNVNLDVTNAYGQDTKYKGSYISVSTTGISKVPENVTVGVYPNPSNGMFTLQSLYGNFPIQSYDVMDLNGKLLLSKECDNSHLENINLNKLNNGMYILKVITSEGSHSLRIIKN